MEKQLVHNDIRHDGDAYAIAFVAAPSDSPEGALLAGEEDSDGKIAVVYNHGDTPPEITIYQTGGHVQTVMANGVAVAVVARADGPRLTSKDVLLVERYVAGRA